MDDLAFSQAKTLILSALESVSGQIGVYPQAVSGMGEEHDYKERDGYKNGWNACHMNYLREVNKALRAIDERMSHAEQLFLTLDDFFMKSDSGWNVFISDTWYWGCADAEFIPVDEYDLVADIVKSYGYVGLLFWVFKKRGHMPKVDGPRKVVEQAISLGLEDKYPNIKPAAGDP